MIRSTAIATVMLIIVTGTSAQQLQHAELLGRPTDHSITIHMIFADAAEVCIEYGPWDGAINRATTWTVVQPDQSLELEVADLEPDTRYRYRVCHRPPGSETITRRPEHAFQTARRPGSGFTFVVQADPHLDEQSDTALYERCLTNQLEDGPDFMIDLGDIMMSDKLKGSNGKVTHDTITARHHLMRSKYEIVSHSVPLFIALGNHEGEAGWTLNNTAENVAVWATNDRNRFFSNPLPNGFYSGDNVDHPFVGKRRSYYAWTWGDALFIVLDPYWFTKPKPDSLHGWRWTLGRDQYEWLRTTLEQKRSTFTFVFAHQLIGGDPDGRGGVEYANLYEWGGQGLDGTNEFDVQRPGWEVPIKDLLTKHRVNIFFHGHDHFFGQQEKDCLIYQETPQPSHPNFQNAGQADDYGYREGLILPNSGHLRVNVDPQGVRVEYVRAYIAANETPNRKNKDVSATYYIGARNCYDSISTGVPVLWNSDYADELVFPTPAHDEATISFGVSTEQRYSCDILNSNGQVIRQLIDHQMVMPGRYEIIWDGRDSNGLLVASGLYFYAIRGDRDGLSTGKIMFQR